jgi:hypothetical protein
MRHRLFVVMLPLLALVATASAGTPGAQVGVGFSALRTTSAVTYWDYWYGIRSTVEFTDLYLPIMVGDGVRIEPEVGLGVNISRSETEWALRLRMGAFGTSWIGDSFMSSFGIRAGIIHMEQTSASVALCLGGDHFFSSHFSLGGEVQLDYCNNSGDYHTVVTTGLLGIRWYPLAGG